MQRRIPYVDIACVLALLCMVAFASYMMSASAPEVGATGYESEREACNRLAGKYKAQVEVVLADKSRADLMSDKYIFECDWAKEKWKEAVGQALYYSIETSKEPAIILLKTGPGDDSHITRCRHVCGRAGITLFVEEAKRCQR